jgi:hypothetical protein
MSEITHERWLLRNCFRAPRIPASAKLLRGSGGGFRRGFRRASMASVATHVTLSIGKLGINVARHRQHHARRFLLGVIVTGKITLHVAVRALDAERYRERSHRHDDLLSGLAGQNLYVLERRWWTLRFILGAEADGDKQQGYRKY